jgi:hypothetical protein
MVPCANKNACTFTTPSSYRHFADRRDKKIRQEMLNYLKEKNIWRPDIKIAWFIRGNLEGRTALEIFQKTLEFSEEAPERAELAEHASCWLKQAENHYTKGLPNLNSLWQRGVVRLWQGKIEEAKEDFAKSLKGGVDKKKVKNAIESYLCYPLHERRAKELLGWIKKEKSGFISTWLKHR